MKAQTTQITVTGIHCVLPQPLCSEPKAQNRTLVLQSTQRTPPTPTSTSNSKEKTTESRGIQGFRVVPTDLERKDGATVVPATWLTSQIDAVTQLAPGKYLSIPVQIDLTAISHSGEYIGSLFIEHSEGNVAIPVTLRIKDSWHLAVPLLLLGVFLAFLMAAYQAEGFDRDEISVKVGQLRSQMNTETDGNTPESETAKFFRSKAEADLVDVANLLDAKAWAEAQKSFLEAQTIWSRWCKERDAWTDLHQYMQQALESYLGTEIPEESVYGKDLQLELKRLKREMATCKTPQEFSELLKPLKNRIQKFLDARSEAERFNLMRTQMGSAGDQWQDALIALEEGLNRISLEDEAQLERWQNSAQELKQKMRQSAEASNFGFRGTMAPAQTFVPSVPKTQERTQEETVQQARWRLQAFRWVGQGVAIAILCGAGFNQLYAANPTFGANAIADYTSLLAWGFTAEVTRDSVSKVLQRFKLPGSGG